MFSHNFCLIGMEIDGEGQGAIPLEYLINLREDLEQSRNTVLF
jgi:hypothetical protein